MNTKPLGTPEQRLAGEQRRLFRIQCNLEPGNIMAQKYPSWVGNKNPRSNPIQAAWVDPASPTKAINTKCFEGVGGFRRPRLQGHDPVLYRQIMPLWPRLVCNYSPSLILRGLIDEISLTRYP